MKRAVILLFGAVAFLGSTAWADSIVFSGTMVITGNGFGNNPRALTIQSHGPGTNTESGCIAPGLIAGASACASGNGAFGGNETSPLGFPKQSAPSLGSLGITSASQIGILFDGVQPQNANNPFVTINDLTLKLYSGSTLLYQVSGTFAPLATNPGNGQSDYLFTLDPAAVAAFNAAWGGNMTDSIALDSTISFANQSAGPDSYSFINLASPVPTPEPGSLFLLGTALAGAAAIIRRRMIHS